jgi:hypothetical protein
VPTASPLTAIIGIGAVLAGAAGAQAQQPGEQLAPDQKVELQVTPYLWFPWTSVNIHPNNTRIPNASQTIDPGTLDGHLTWVPFMGAAEFRYGGFGLVIDYIHAPVKGGISTRQILYTGASAGLELDIGSLLLLYRAFAQSGAQLDVGLGVRAWGLSGSIALAQGLLPPANVSNGLSWADPQLAVRYHAGLGGPWAATFSADVGGFDAGAHVDWQLIGTIDYTAASWLELRGGFRSLNVDYGGSRADFDLHMYGPIIGGTVRF